MLDHSLSKEMLPHAKSKPLLNAFHIGLRDWTSEEWQAGPTQQYRSRVSGVDPVD